MSKVVLTLAATTVGLGLVSLHLVKQLRESDASVAELKTQLATLQEQVTSARVSTLLPEPVVDGGMEAPAAPVPTAESKPPKKSAEEPRQAMAPGATWTAMAIPPPVTSEDRARMMRDHHERQRQLMQDPDYREAMRLQARVTYSHQYPGLIEELGFDRAQADEFFDMLADQQVRLTAEAQPMWEIPGAEDPAAQQRHQKLQQTAAEMQRNHEAEIAARFGENTLQTWKEYQTTLGQRWQLEQMRSTLASQGLPLGEEVRKPMLKALVEVQKQNMQEAAAAANGTSARLVASMMPFDERGMEQQIEASKRQNQRVLDAVSSYLTVEQRQALERQQEEQLKLHEAQMRMMRAQGATNSSVIFLGGSAAIPAKATQ